MPRTTPVNLESEIAAASPLRRSSRVAVRRSSASETPNAKENGADLDADGGRIRAGSVPVGGTPQKRSRKGSVDSDSKLGLLTPTRRSTRLSSSSPIPIDVDKLRPRHTSESVEPLEAISEDPKKPPPPLRLTRRRRSSADSEIIEQATVTKPPSKLEEIPELESSFMDEGERAESPVLDSKSGEDLKQKKLWVRSNEKGEEKERVAGTPELVVRVARLSNGGSVEDVSKAMEREISKTSDESGAKISNVPDKVEEIVAENKLEGEKVVQETEKVEKAKKITEEAKEITEEAKKTTAEAKEITAEAKKIMAEAQTIAKQTPEKQLDTSKSGKTPEKSPKWIKSGSDNSFSFNLNVSALDSTKGSAEIVNTSASSDKENVFVDENAPTAKNEGLTNENQQRNVSFFEPMDVDEAYVAEKVTVVPRIRCTRANISKIEESVEVLEPKEAENAEKESEEDEKQDDQTNGVAVDEEMETAEQEKAPKLNETADKTRIEETSWNEVEDERRKSSYLTELCKLDDIDKKRRSRSEGSDDTKRSSYLTELCKLDNVDKKNRLSENEINFSEVQIVRNSLEEITSGTENNFSMKQIETTEVEIIRTTTDEESLTTQNKSKLEEEDASNKSITPRRSARLSKHDTPVSDGSKKSLNSSTISTKSQSSINDEPQSEPKPPEPTKQPEPQQKSPEKPQNSTAEPPKPESLDNKLNSLVNNHSTDDESEISDFLDTLAEEGEEDTPSEDSNAIIDEGESINSTESQVDSDESYEQDSFIADDEPVELLSGDENFLETSSEKKAKGKYRRIVSRGSSDDEAVSVTPTCGSMPHSPTSVLDELPAEEAVSVTATYGALVDEPAEKAVPKIVVETCDEVVNVSTYTEQPSVMEESLDVSTASLNTSRKRVSSINIQENLTLDEVMEVGISTRVSKVMDIFCSELSNKSGEIKLNVSIDFVDDKQEEREQKSGDTAVITEDKFNIKQVVIMKPPTDEPKKTPKRAEGSAKKPKTPKLEHVVSSQSDNRTETESVAATGSDTSSIPRKEKKKKLKKHRELQKPQSLDESVDFISSEPESTVQKKKKKKRKAQEALTPMKPTQQMTPKSDIKVVEYFPEVLLSKITELKKPKRKLQVSAPAAEGWEVEVLEVVKPSVSNKVRWSSGEDESAPKKKKKNKVEVPSHPKDFKTQMLYSGRVKRIDTKSLIKKKQKLTI